MDAAGAVRTLTGPSRRALIAGVVLLALAVAGKSAFLGLIGLALLVRPCWTLYRATLAPAVDEPWPWPADFRATAEGMARPIDPTPKRLLPPEEKASEIAHVATTRDALARLIAEKPPAWPWAVFASVLLQRRNAVTDRLRRCASGYQPRPGTLAASGADYTRIAAGAMDAISDLARQTEQFMLSPAFTGVLRDATAEDTADADAIAAVADRLMDYHQSFLQQAEACLQTRVQSEALVFVQDVGTLALCPLLGYEQFIATMCARVGEAQDLLPYTSGGDVVALDDATLTMTVPDGLTDRIVAHVGRFTA